MKQTRTTTDYQGKVVRKLAAVYLMFIRQQQNDANAEIWKAYQLGDGKPVGNADPDPRM